MALCEPCAEWEERTGSGSFASGACFERLGGDARAKHFLTPFPSAASCRSGAAREPLHHSAHWRRLWCVYELQGLLCAHPLTTSPHRPHVSRCHTPDGHAEDAAANAGHTCHQHVQIHVDAPGGDVVASHACHVVSWLRSCRHDLALRVCSLSRELRGASATTAFGLSFYLGFHTLSPLF